MTVISMIYCTDCHNSSDDSGAKGPHGSDYPPLLAANYDTADYTSESEFSYQLCYKCHSRNSILNNESFPKHKEHLDKQITCSACHDPHGISAVQGTSTNNSHLINFDTSIVRTHTATSRLEFQDTGIYHGRCYLECHNKTHGPETY